MAVTTDSGIRYVQDGGPHHVRRFVIRARAYAHGPVGHAATGTGALLVHVCHVLLISAAFELRVLRGLHGKYYGITTDPRNVNTQLVFQTCVNDFRELVALSHYFP